MAADEPQATPDAAFSNEFGTGDLATRLWRGGLRVDHGNLCLARDGSVARLRRAVSSNVNESIADALVEEAEGVFEVDARLLRSTRPLSYCSAEAQRGRPSVVQQSLLRVLLSVDALQPSLLNCLVNRMSEGGDLKIGRATLSAMKWLDRLVDGKGFAESLLSAADIMATELKRDVIEALPEIVDDASRPYAVDHLVELMRGDPQLTDVVVDTLGALGVDSSRVEGTNGAILAALSSAKPDILPVTVKYLIATCPPDMLDDTVAGLRQNLAAQSLGPASGRLCLDALRSGLRMRKPFADHVLGTLKRASESSLHRPADIWFLLALLDSPQHRKAAEVMFRKKAASGLFHESLVDRAIAPFSTGFADQTSRILALASICLKAAEPGARRTGVHIFSLVYRLFSDSSTTCRDVLAFLLEHTGSRRPQEVDAALDALVAIAREAEKTGGLIPHSASLHGLLDFLETFSDFHLRKVWTLFAYLCRASIHRSSQSGGAASQSGVPGENEADDDDDDDDDDVDDEAEYEMERSGLEFSQGNVLEQRRRRRGDAETGGLATNEPELAPFMILLRKEVTHTDPLYRRIGILGVCTFVKLLPAAYGKEVYDLLGPAAATAPSSEAMAYDELAQTFSHSSDVRSVDKKTVSFLCKIVADSFEKRFIADASLPGDKVEEPELKHDLWFNLDGEDADVCLPVSRYLVGNLSMTEKPDVLVSLAPHLRLLCVLMKAKSESLEDIDAVLSCPLRLPLRDNVNDFGNLARPTKNLVLGALFVGYAWLVEVLNAFASETDPELRAKCLLRMDHLLEMETLISSCIEEMPTWRDALCLACPDKVNAHTYVSPRGNQEGLSAAGKQLGPDCESSSWVPLVRTLSPSALALVSVVSPVTFSPSEVVPESSGGLGRTEKTVRLSPASLEHLLCGLRKQVEAGLAMDPVLPSGALGRSVLEGNEPAGTKGRYSKASDSASAMGGVLVLSPLAHFQTLRTPLVALGPQLSASLLRMQSDGTTFVAGEETVSYVECRDVFQRCVLLCLKCLAGTLASDALREEVGGARELLFDILAMVHFNGDSVPALSPSEPVGLADVQLAAKKAFSELWTKLDSVWGDEGDGALSDAQEEDSEAAGGGWGQDKGSLAHFESVSALLAVLDAIFGMCSPSARSKGRLDVKLSDAAGRLLERYWDDGAMKSRKANKILPGVIRMYVRWASEPKDAIATVRRQLELFEARSRQIEAEKKRGNVDESDGDRSAGIDAVEGVECTERRWGCITPRTFKHIYVSLLEQTLSILKRCKEGKGVESDELLDSIQSTSTTFNDVLELVRKEERYVGPAMRAGRSWVDIFMRSAMPILRQASSQHLAKVVEILKVQRGLIRILQQLCSHSKAIQDRALSSLVPPLRRSLEACLYKMREQLQSHRETGKVTLLFGTLATRDITGKKLTRNALVESADELSDDLLEDEDMDGDENCKAADAESGDELNGTENEEDGNGVVRKANGSQLMARKKVAARKRASQSQKSGCREKTGKKAGKNAAERNSSQRKSTSSKKRKSTGHSDPEDWDSSDGQAGNGAEDSEDVVGSDDAVVASRQDKPRAKTSRKKKRRGSAASNDALFEDAALGRVEDGGGEGSIGDGDEDDESPVVVLKSRKKLARGSQGREGRAKSGGNAKRTKVGRSKGMRRNGGVSGRSKLVDDMAGCSDDEDISGECDEGTFDSFLVDDEEDVE